MQKKTITTILLFTIIIASFGQNAKHYDFLEDAIPDKPCINKDIADSIFVFFKNNPLFLWSDHNNCEDRANGICILLDKWKVPNCKGWVIKGSILNKPEKGMLKDKWGHHITAVVPVCVDNITKFFAIDPATQKVPVLLEVWADSVSLKPTCYFFNKLGEYVDVDYNLGDKMLATSWQKRDKTNYEWTMQGLTGYNGGNLGGKIKIKLHKKRTLETTDKFEHLTKPAFL